jgi:hypothetical protein
MGPMQNFQSLKSAYRYIYVMQYLGSCLQQKREKQKIVQALQSAANRYIISTQRIRKKNFEEANF